MSQLVYRYAFGFGFGPVPDNVPGYSITINKHNYDVYEIIYIEQSFDPDFNKIQTTHRIIEKYSTVNFIQINDNTLCKRTTEIRVKVANNPRPEQLFTII